MSLFYFNFAKEILLVCWRGLILKANRRIYKTKVGWNNTSSISTQSDFIYFFGIKSPYLTASWSLKASPNILPAGMIYSKNAHFLYFFSQDSANLFLTIINNWSGSLTNEILFGGIPNPNIFSEKLLEIDAQTAGSLVWVGDNPSSPSSPLIIHILLNNVTG